MLKMVLQLSTKSISTRNIIVPHRSLIIFDASKVELQEYDK
jgi:hypothetical protein